MNAKIPVWIALLLVVAAIIIMYLVPAKKTTVKVGAETLSVVVVQPDTVHAYKTVHDVVTSVQIDTVHSVASSSDLSVGDSIRVDTSHCYTIDEHEKDGAYIAATLCSRYFTALPPPDLRGSITYKAAPDTQRTIRRVDTLTRTKTNWPLSIAGFTIGIGVGGYAVYQLTNALKK